MSLAERKAAALLLAATPIALPLGLAGLAVGDGPLAWALVSPALAIDAWLLAWAWREWLS